MKKNMFERSQHQEVHNSRIVNQLFNSGLQHQFSTRIVKSEDREVKDKEQNQVFLEKERSNTDQHPIVDVYLSQKSIVGQKHQVESLHKIPERSFMNNQSNIQVRYNESGQEDNNDLRIDNEDLKQLQQQYYVEVPNEHQILQIVNILHNMNGNVPFETILKQMNRYYQTDVNNKDSIDKLPKPVPKTPNFLNEDHPEYKPSFHTSEVEKYTRKHRIRKLYSSNQSIDYNQQERKILQRKIAYVFIVKGYGLNTARQFLGENINNNLYNSLLTAIIRFCLRKMVDVLRSHLHLNIQGFNGTEQIQIRSPMANCRKWMSPLDLGTLFKFIAKEYALNNGQNQQKVYPIEVIRLYNTICERQLTYKKRICESILSGKPLDMIRPPPVRNDHNMVKEPERPRQYKLTKSIGHTIQDSIQESKMVSELDKQIINNFAKFGNIEEVVHIFKKQRRPHSFQDVVQSLSRTVKRGLQNLVNNYKNLYFKDRSLPELLLSQESIVFIANDRRKGDFKTNMVRMMMEIDFGSKDQIMSLVTHINSFIVKYNLNSKYHGPSARKQNLFYS